MWWFLKTNYIQQTEPGDSFYFIFIIQNQQDDLDLLNDETFGVSDDVSELNDGKTCFQFFIVKSKDEII